MLETLIEWDKALLLGINGWNSPFFDDVMFLISDKWIWIPMYVSMLYLLIRSKQYNALYAVVAVALTVLFADQFASGLCKPFFARLRPTHDPSMQPYVHLVHGHLSGLYGFCSSHASNTCGIAMLTALIFRNRWYTAAVASWAVLNCYSRMYMGVHYPGDILCGAAAGLIIGYLCYKLYTICPSFAKVTLTPIQSQQIVDKQVRVVIAVYLLTLLGMVVYAAW
jgi:undecaprenyl-diphosphatase